MAADILIRNAEADDMSAVHDLIRELAIYENEEHQLINTVDDLINDGFGSDPVFECIVATHKNKVIGFALFYTSYSTWRGRCLFLEDFLVTESWRRKGVGKLLFDRVFEIAKQRNVGRFEWQVLDWNKPAINFYEKYETIFDAEWINCKIFIRQK